MRIMKVAGLLVLMAVLAACGSSGDGETTGRASSLTVENVTASLSLPTTTGAVYMEITNGSGRDDALIGAEVPGCGVVELHEMLMQDDVMMMRQVADNRIPVPAGQTVMLERGGLHVMCIDKTGEFAVGDRVPVTLLFEKAGEIIVEAEVLAPAGGMSMDSDMEMDNGMGGHSMDMGSDE